MIYRISKSDAFDSGRLNELLGRLNSAQKEYLERKRESSVKQSLVARALLLDLLEENGYEDLVGKLMNDQNGRLYIEGAPELFVSISHSRNAVAAAVSNRPVGIDIEYIRPVSERLQKRVCKTLPESEAEFFRFWTEKEAYLKLTDISFAEMLVIDHESICKKANVFTKTTDGYCLSVVEMK